MVSAFRSLVIRIVVNTAAIYATVTIALLLLTWTIVRSSFSELETELMLQHRQRVLSVVAEERRELSTLSVEWSAWDPLGDFIEKPNEEFLTSNLTLEWRKQVGLDLILFVRREGSVPFGTWLVDGEYVDTVRESEGWTPGLGSLMPPIRKALGPLTSRVCSELLLPSARGPLYLSLCPVLRSDFTGEPRGALIFGRILSPGRLAEIARSTQTTLALTETGPDAITLAAADPLRQIERTNTTLSIPVALPYEGNVSGIVFHVKENRRLWNVGVRTLLLLGLTITVGGLAMVIALLFLIRASVLSPVGRIAQHMRQFLSHEDPLKAPVLEHSDELGQLADDYSSLLHRIKDRSAQLQHANEQLETIAHTDRLTGLPNRRMFDMQTTREIRRMRRDQEGSSNRRLLGVLLCDVDCFKQYNDTLGHVAGDACLAQLAAALQSSLRRAGDLAFRFGGEEFVILLPGCDLGGAQKIAEIVRGNVEALGVPHPTSPVTGVVTISLGAAVAAVNESFSLEALLESADRALYAAKAAGRNRVSSAPVPEGTVETPEA